LGTGNFNTAVGSLALSTLSTAADNTAVGYQALKVNQTGSDCTAVGYNALTAATGIENTAIGSGAGVAITTGTNNIAIGYHAGGTLTTGSGNIYINANAGTASESNTIRIGTSQTACYIHIKDIDETAENIFKLRPVTFIYNNDETNRQQYGLIAEEVNEVFPEIVLTEENGQPYTVQYHVLPVLLLHELQKQHTTIEELKKNDAQRDIVIQNLMERVKALERLTN
jgi:hypothetical protein